MSLPRILLVDDSEAMLAYERAALGDHYELVTAHDGVEALERLAVGTPEAMLLDLSMPRMNGEQVLERMRANPAFAAVPVIVISTEEERALALGDKIAAFVKKPAEGPVLRSVVERVLEAARRAREEGGLPALRVDVGPLEIALPLTAVRQVVPQPLCEGIDDGPAWLREAFTLEGDVVAVVELAALCGVDARAGYVDRSLVVLQGCRVPIALAVDRVRHPEVVPESDVGPPPPPGRAPQALEKAVTGALRVGEASVPLVDPATLLPDDLWAALAGAVR